MREIIVENTRKGFSYNARGEDGRIVYNCPRFFRTKLDARDDIVSRWGHDMRIVYR